MKFLKQISRYDVLLPLFLCASSLIIGSIAQDDGVCLIDDDALLANNRLQRSFNSMINQFNSTSTSETLVRDIDPVELYLIHDYRKLGSSLMKTVCERRRNYKMCRVTTKTQFKGLVEGIPTGLGVEFGTFIMELSKPVCFPPTCREDQIALVDPNPAKCNGPEGALDCEVLSYDVRCPDRTQSRGDCDDDTLPNTSIFYAQRLLNEATILADCALAANGNPSTYCTFGFGDVSGNAEAHMGGAFVDDPYYKNHARICDDVGGVLCTADLEGGVRISKRQVKDLVEEALEIAELNFALSKYGSVSASGKVMQLPQCIANSCPISQVESLYVSHLEAILADQGLPFECELGSSACNVTISNIRCNRPTDAPTSSPPTISFPPTKNPTTSPTDKPTTSPTTSPTSIPTPGPTNSPTSSATKPPTPSPTKYPTSTPTTSPTSLPTAAPTKSPTANPTQSTNTNDPTNDFINSITIETSAATTVAAGKSWRVKMLSPLLLLLATVL